MSKSRLYDTEPPEIDVTAEGEYDIGEDSTHFVELDDGLLVVRISFSGDIIVRVSWKGDVDYDTALWTAVFWCRDYGVYGVNKERLYMESDSSSEDYRLGALYCLAGFEFTERESNYDKYGERSIAK